MARERGAWANGGINHSFGAKARTQGAVPPPSYGKYTIYHDIGHTKYNVIPVITGVDDNSTNIAREIASLRTATSCVVRITNLANNTVHVPFTVTIFGKNYV